MHAAYAAILSATPLPQILIGPDERIAAANRGAARLFGEAMSGRHYITVLRQPAILDRVEAVLGDGDPGGAALFLATEASRDASWRVTVAPLPWEGGKVGALATFEDVTAEQEARQIRRDFVANVSHELRTPLTALLGFIETLRGAAREDRAAQDRFLAIMAHEAGRMNRLVDDLLSLNRVEQDERVRPTEPVDTGALMDSVALTLRPLADEAKVVIEVATDPRAPLVPGDPDQLAQVLTNLTENAIKYGARGGRVRLIQTFVAREASLRMPAVRIDVIDEGEGLDPIHIPRLTERFYRADTHRSRELGGTGLGLAIVKHIINRHRGRLRISSRPGEGSVFSVILPTDGFAPR